MTTHVHRDVLSRETAHLTTADKEAINACFAYAQRLAHAAPANVEAAIVAQAIEIKLFTLNSPPPAWVRALIAKAAVEAPLAWSEDEAVNRRVVEAAEHALRRAKA